MLDDEQELLRTHPHILAYFPHYALWFWFIAIGVAGLLAGPAIGESLRTQGGSIPLTSIAWSALDAPSAWFLVWASAVLVPAAVLPFFAVSFRALLSLVLVLAIGGVILGARTHVHGGVTGLIDLGFLQPLWDMTGKPTPDALHYESVLVLSFGALGVIVVEFRRGSCVWILTNKRLIARFGLISKSERDLLYGSVDDIVIHQGLLGSLFNFGTVIPLSMGGLAADHVEAETRVRSGKNKEGGPAKKRRKRGLKVELGNGRRVVIPRKPTFYMLWGVPSPRDRKDLILAQIGKGAAAPVRPAASGRAGAISQRQAVTDTD